MSIPVQIRDHVLARPVTLGSGRLVCIDGPSGSGKTTVARQLAGLLPATTIHTDELCPGWEGLPLVPGVLARLLEPLAAGRPGSYREWDWIGGGPGDDRTVQPAPLLIVEGLGTGARRLRGWTTALVWIDADPEHRRVRALDRDGDYFRAQWAPWAASETAYFETEGLPGRADLHFWTG